MNNSMNYVATPRLGFSEAVKRVLNNLTNVNGRARRSEYWWFVLATIIVNGIFCSIFGSTSIIYAVVSVLVSLCTVAVSVRRLHDSGHNAIWVYINFVSGVIMVVYIYATGFFELANTLNPNPEKIFETLSSPVYAVSASVSFICGLVIFIFSLFDSNMGPNKYGDSPKYIPADSQDQTASL